MPSSKKTKLAIALAVAAMAVACAELPASGDGADAAGWGSRFTWLQPAKAPHRTPIQSPAGQIDLDAFAGKLVVLNFWAAWCPPCVKELPSLDRLQARWGGSDLAVVAVSVDRADLVSAKLYFKRLRIAQLTPYADPTHQTAHFDKANTRGAPFALYRMPITYVIAPDGAAIAYVAGPAAWDSADAVAFLRALARRYSPK